MSSETKLFQLFSTEIKGDILVLFHTNPGVVDTSDGIARRIGRTANAIQEDVQDLVTIGILTMHKIGAHDVIALNPSKDNETQESIVMHLRTIKPIRAV